MLRSLAQKFALHDVPIDPRQASINLKSTPVGGDSVQKYQTASCATVVAGGSDERPNTRSDQRLARHRVKSVCQYLLRHGIMEARMKAVRIGAPVSVFSHAWRDGRRRRPRVEACRQP